jgi:hypothetical protein
MLLKTKTSPVKNPVWAHYTPNELYDSDILSNTHLGMEYSTFLPMWKLNKSVTGRNAWFEVRITKSKAEVEIGDRSAWWRQPEFMDKIFWVFQQPQWFEMDKKRFFCYNLEPFEGQRVAQVGEDKLGYNPFEGPFPALHIPVECTEMAWSETSNGYSDHGRPREEEHLTAQEKEDALETEHDVAKILSEIQDVDSKADEIAGKMS